MTASAPKLNLPSIAEQQEAQRRTALDPTRSVWVSASAGSGKTTLLTERVLRLLLQNRIEGRKRLSNILCLTYTKAAAAEMQNRIHKQLSLWSILSEADLQATLEKTFEIRTNPDVLRKARRLFAEVLERPDAVRIMTMHAFCQLILNRFPHEAGLAPHFTLLEGEEEKLFQERILSQCYAHIRKDKALSDALQTLAVTQSSGRTKDMLCSIFKDAARWQRFFEDVPTPEQYAKLLQKNLALSFTGTVEEFLAMHCALPHVDERALETAASILQTGSKTDKESAVTLLAWLKNPSTRVATFDDYWPIYLTQKDETLRENVCTKTLAKKHPDIAETLQQEARRIEHLVAERNKLLFYHQQIAFYTLAKTVWNNILAAKQHLGQLTYDDIILRTRDLLTRSRIAPWILYKLDGGIDHMLIDEAQDTSPPQWDIIFALLDELLAGQGAREDTKRTIFVVGDEKQSIYSFQGANHHHYLEVKDHLIERFKHLPTPMAEVERTQSYRSSSAVLSFVDEVFKPQEVQAGVSTHTIRHYANRAQQGLVQLWSPIETEKKELPPAWHPPLQREDGRHAYIQLAHRIADSISEWLHHGWHLKQQFHDQSPASRPIRADDIIILLQHRSHLLTPIIRALKERNVPVAGIDRMVLHEQAAVQDVLGFCRFLLLPDDDLTLAEVLRGPFIGITDGQLFEVARGRSGTLWHAVQSHVGMQPVAEYLKSCLALTDTLPTYAFLSQLFHMPCPGHQKGGRPAIVARLGIDAIDPLDQLLSAAQDFDVHHPLSLQLFVRFISQNDTQLKREQAEAKGEVRIMTTHGAKGLEAPIVIIPDLMRNPDKQGKADPLYWGNGIPYASTAVAKYVGIFQNAKNAGADAREEEQRRLLYVALTRAADVLILCGAIAKQKTFSPWYQYTKAATEQLKTDVSDTPHGTVWDYGDRATLTPHHAGSNAPSEQITVPQWLITPAANETRTKIYNPSHLIDEEERQLAPTHGTASSYVRGQLLHRLLQLLPNMNKTQQQDAATRYLTQRYGANNADVEHDVREVMAVLHHPAFAPVFTPAAQTEVPIVGTLAGKHFSGQIDRLLVTEKEVLVVDFKTNRPPPTSLADVHAGYLAQMACYSALLSALYPGKPVRAALLWTHTLTLMELDNAALQRGRQILDRLGS